MTHSDELTDEQAHWLTKILESRPKRGLLEQFEVPHDVYNALIAKGLIRWHHRAIEITLDGIRAVARRPLPQD